MQAAASNLMVMDGYLPRPAIAELRLANWRPLPALRPALAPAMMVSLRMAMGAGVGAVLGMAAGNLGFWAAAGIGLGAVLNRIVSQVSVPGRDQAREAGIYRLER